MCDLRSDTGKLHIVSIGKLLLSEWLLHGVPGADVSLQQDMHQVYHSLRDMCKFSRSVLDVYRGVVAAQFHMRDSLPFVRLHWGGQEMFVMPIKLSQLPDINQLLTVRQRLLPAARRLRLILPDQLPNHHKPPMPSMWRCVLNLLNLKIKLHIMQDKLVQTLVHMCRLMSDWLLL